mmetsp:Transcript_30453/g.49252  ORF Transcript_30453/g.49252 Transcript_30453/m.49252 type:complete len:1212 (+) Transcript_30453:94-3729(+)|eukprot:CAMPEP_0184671010 /NCGR_PEP_ID=MMETSP0308-20130426/84938_1 /TAXON_ID=38269 /ORGANISM="Gloeochaete witrockiana, Strain SAG 46.84" /LENGTH=1211 /DNA_ID=CAMNT_0027118003 /DNA_START=81 /DNA_END=3716 /DNA_ORIENTATION=-
MADTSAWSVRRAEPADEAVVAQLISGDPFIIRAKYGVESIAQLIETALLAVTVVDGNDGVVAFAAFTDYPTLPATEGVDPSCWEEWFKKMYDCPDMKVFNTIWLGFFAAESAFEKEASNLVIRTVFTSLSYIEACLIVTHYKQAIFPPFNVFGASEVALRANLNETDIAYTIYSIATTHFVPHLTVRAARVEDHDDLVPIFNEQSELLTERYGEFFLAQLIENQDANNRALVAEVNGRAVGLLALSTEVDIQMLQKNFELEAFGSLVIPSERKSQLESTRDDDDDLGKSSVVARRLSLMGTSTRGHVPALDVDSPERPLSALYERRGTPRPADVTDPASSRTTAVPLPESFIVQGQSNAFCVTLFCLDERYECRSGDFLKAAFQLFREREYCVISIPHTVPEFQFLASFTRVHPRVTNTFTQVLYVYHRSALGGVDEVRKASLTDRPALESLLTGMTDSHRAAMITSFESAVVKQAASAASKFRQLSKYAYVALSAGFVIGAATLEDAADEQGLRDRYDLDQFLDFSSSADSSALGPALIVLHFVINPIFATSSRVFLKEILRRQSRARIYYQEWPHSVVPSILPHLVPVPPRRQVQTPGQAEPDLSFALHLMARRLVTETKTVVNARVVVVGASDAGISFIEKLIMTPYLDFKSITLVSPGGVPSGAAQGETSFVASSYCYTRTEYMQLAVSSKIRVVDAKMINIDRKRKTILLPAGFVIPYDILVLSTGLQDQSLSKLGPEIAAIDGVFSLSNETSVARLQKHIAAKFLDGWGMAVVYGSTLNAYCAVQGLMASGVAPSRITMVHPPPSTKPGGVDADITSFNNPRIDAQMEVTLERAGVHVHHNSVLASVESTEDEGSGTGDLSAIVLQDMAASGEAGGTQWVACRLLVCCDEANVDPDCFMAINDNSIVYDARIITDHRFATNDPSIYATGTLVRYARRYRPSSLVQYANSREVGAHLAAVLLPILDPAHEGGRPPASASAASQQPPSATAAGVNSNDFLLLPHFTLPKARGGILPGKLYYVHAESPGKPQRLESAMASPNYGRDLVTVVEETDYFRVHVDQYDTVESITYLGRQPVQVNNLLSILGLPVSYLNHMVERYDEGLISNFLTFFRGTWTIAVYHDRFTVFRQQLRSHLAQDRDVVAAERVLSQVLDSTQEVEAEQRVEVRRSGGSGMKKTVQEQVLSHLRQNSTQLSMFWTSNQAIAGA